MDDRLTRPQHSVSTEDDTILRLPTTPAHHAAVDQNSRHSAPEVQSKTLRNRGRSTPEGATPTQPPSRKPGTVTAANRQAQATDSSSTRQDSAGSQTTKDAHPLYSKSPTHVQRALPLLTARPLVVKTNQGTGTATAPDATPVAPLRWRRADPAPAHPGGRTQVRATTPVQRFAHPPTSLRSSGDEDLPIASGSNGAPPRIPQDSGLSAQENLTTAPSVRRPKNPSIAPTSRQHTTPVKPPPPTRASSSLPGVPPGVPVTVVQRDAQPPRAAEPEPKVDAERDAGSPNIDDLARRLIEPVSRLLRAELRQGRERIGRLHDRRR